ncbi:MAG: DM13 domain-containing protein [Bacteroidia bacterium]
MNKNIVVLLCGLFLLASCKKNIPPTFVNESLPTSTTTLATGSFVSSAHPTSGSVKIVKDEVNKLYLVFENFKTDGGPDLRTWMSPNNNASSFHELGFLKATTGNFFYELEAPFIYTTNDHVLIWCKQFKVLFGYAVLK